MTDKRMDIICIIGKNEDKPVWRKVGVFLPATRGKKPMLLLDRTFCAAGVIAEDGFASAPLYLSEQTDKPAAARHPAFRDQQFDDDIPF